MSAENWGHVERGYQSLGRGKPVRVVIPPADTLAHMALVVGLRPGDLAEIGRDDAAESLRDLLAVTREAKPAGGAASVHVHGGAGTVLTESPARRMPRWFVSELERRGLPVESVIGAVEMLQSLADHFGYSVTELLLRAGLVPAPAERPADHPPSQGKSGALAEFDAAVERILSNPLLSRRQRKAAETFAAEARREVLENPENR